MTNYTHGYMWFNKCMESPCNCLALSGFGIVHKYWPDLVYEMNQSLKKMEVSYEINPECTPQAVHENNGEMIYATYQNNYGSYIVKLVLIFE